LIATHDTLKLVIFKEFGKINSQEELCKN